MFFDVEKTITGYQTIVIRSCEWERLGKIVELGGHCPLCHPLASWLNDSGNNSANNYYNLNKSLIIHHCNLQLLMVEILNTKNNLNLTVMKDIFAEKIAITACKIQIIYNCRR